MLCNYGCGKEAIYQLKNGKWCCSKNQNSCKIIRDKKSHKHGKTSETRENPGFCEYGCGKEAIYQLKNGKWCCSKSSNSCSKLKFKKSITLKNFYLNNPEAKEKTKHVGSDNGNYKDGRCNKDYFCKCGKKIGMTSTYCHSCAAKNNENLIKSHNNRSVEHLEKIGIASKNKFTKDYLNKVRKTYEKLGLWIPLDQIKPYELYCRKSNWIERMIDYVSEQELVLLKNYGMFSSKNSKGVVRDHRYSRYSGFKNNVDPIILRHPANCEIILHKDNLSKAKKGHRYEDSDSITLKELFNKIINYQKQWKEQEKCIQLIKEYEMKNEENNLSGVEK
jgi:hypothetical protein